MMDESHSNSLTQAKIMSDIESIQDLRSIAHQTLKILQDGTYVSRDDEIVSIKQELSTAVSHTFLYTPEEGEMLLSNGRSYGNTELPIVKITQETTQDAVIRLKVIEQKQDLLVLNFASARNPGGGFLNGAMAQEESLSRCSGLYQTLLAKPMFYEAHRMQSSLLYSDNIIYSPKVPWFRAADYSLLSHPISASFITSAAPNSGRLKDVTAVQLLDVIRTRVGKILAVAEANGHRTLLLGAWGCGVFRNDPTVVSDAFSSWLQSPRFAGSFDSVTFSIADNSKNKHVLKAFELTFTTSGHE